MANLRTIISLILCIAVIIRYFHTFYDYSTELLHMNSSFSQLKTLRNGWILGRQMDNSDHQLAVFSANFPYLLLIFVPVWCAFANWGREIRIDGDFWSAELTVRRVPATKIHQKTDNNDPSFSKNDAPSLENGMKNTENQAENGGNGAENTESQGIRCRIDENGSKLGENRAKTGENGAKSGENGGDADDIRSTCARFYCLSGLVFAFLALGVPGIYPLFWVYLNHIFSANFAGKTVKIGSLGPISPFPIAIWALNLIFLVTSDLQNGFSGRFSAILTDLTGSQILPRVFDYSGIVRWQIYSRFVSLRCISFGMDRHWAIMAAKMRKVGAEMREVGAKMRENGAEMRENGAEMRENGAFSAENGAGIEKKSRFEGKPLYYRLQEEPRPLHEYGLAEFTAYVFYAPLFLAGPICTFNAFSAQFRPENRIFTAKSAIFRGFLAISAYLIALNVYLHYNYSYAILKDGQYEFFSGWECWCLQYSVLKGTMWLKFLIIWRFFRLFSLMDGVSAPENMERCMSNNQTFSGFWRSWHASFNIFNIRYIFVPLGGRKNQIFLVWLIFVFVALWHELSLQWLAWGVFNAAFLSIEVVVMGFAGPIVDKMPFARYLTAFFSTFSIASLMFSNLAIQLGFAESIEFTRTMYFNGWRSGLEAFGMTAVYYTAAAILMRERRENEKLGRDEMQKRRT